MNKITKLMKPKNWKNMPFYIKIQYFCIFITKEYSLYVDKLIAKNKALMLCKNKNLHIAKVSKILKDLFDISQDDIKNNYIIKSAHASRWNIILSENMTREIIIEKLLTYNKIYSTREMQYKHIKPKFFIEEIINDKYFGYNGKALAYYFYCINGKIQFIRIDDPIQDETDTYDKNWNLISKKYMNLNFEKPSNHEEIINIVEDLCMPFEFVRIDLFIGKNDEIYFSEFTFTPNGGYQFFDNIDRYFIDEWK